MYVPEGYTLDLPFIIPEWIMAYKYIGQVNMYNDYTTLPRIKTRLSRD